MGKLECVMTVSCRWLAAGILAMAVAPLTGCRICPDCEDIAYPAYGGSWQRTRRDSGRVGSVFDPAGAKTAELTPRDSPTASDELERLRRKDRVPRMPDPQDLPEGDEPAPGTDRRDDLRQRGLDDLDDDDDSDLRKKNLQDIEVKVVPGEQMPPLLR